MLTGEEINKRSPWSPASDEHKLPAWSEALVVKSVTTIGAPHPGGAGKVPGAASTLIVPVFSATPPVAEVVKLIV